MFDGSHHTFERLARQDSVLVIPVMADGRIVLTEQEQPNKPPFITFAGGRVDPGETALQCAKRELLEETGSVSEDVAEWFQITPADKLDWTIHTYIARGCKRVQEQELDPGEKITITYISFEQFLDLAANDKLREKDVTIKVLQAKLDQTKMTELKRLFFG